MNLIDEIKCFEEFFSANKYNGSGEQSFEIQKGRIPILISASHAVNHFRKGQVKAADTYTGGIGMYLHQITGCHFMYLAQFSEMDPNFDSMENNSYQQALKEYVDINKIKVVIDLHGAKKDREFAIEMGTALERSMDRNVNPSLKGHDHIAIKIRDIFEEEFAKIEGEKEEIWKNQIFSAGGQNTVTKYVYQNTDAVGIQLEVNRIYRDPQNREEMTVLVEGLKKVIEYLELFFRIPDDGV